MVHLEPGEEAPGGLPVVQPEATRTRSKAGLGRTLSSPGVSGCPAPPSPVGSAAAPSDTANTTLPSLALTRSSSTPSRGVRWRQRSRGRWPVVHKVDSETDPYQPAMRIRSLICNYPGHFCKESLLMVPGGSEPIAPPYRLTVCCDLRPRREELRTKSAFLVAYDTEKLRRSGMGMGADPREVSESWIARYAICSEVVRLRRFFGEVQITLHPPDSSEGSALVLLRVVTVTDPSDLQDWHAIGDPLVLQVEPRLTREDKRELARLQGKLAELGEGGAPRQLSEAKDRAFSELEEALQRACADLQAPEAAASQAQIAERLQAALASAKRMQAEAAEESRSTMSASLSRSQLSLGTSQEGAGQLLESRGGKSKAQAALSMQQVVNRSTRHQLWERSKDVDDARSQLQRAREELEASESANSELRAAAEQARLEAEVWESAANDSEKNLLAAREELSELKLSAAGGRSPHGMALGLSSWRQPTTQPARPFSSPLRPKPGRSKTAMAALGEANPLSPKSSRTRSGGVSFGGTRDIEFAPGDNVKSDAANDAASPSNEASNEAPQEVSLEVTVVSARGLRSADTFFKSDPFCVCRVGDEELFRTKTVSNDVSPVWTETFDVPKYRLSSSLLFSIYDEDSGSAHDLLGSVLLGSERFWPGGTFEGELPLAEDGEGVEAFLTLRVAVVQESPRP